MTASNLTRVKTLGGLPTWVAQPDPLLYLGDNYVVVDFETPTALKGSPILESNRIILACWNRNYVRASDSNDSQGQLLSSGGIHAVFGETLGESGESVHTMHHRFGGEYDLGELVEAIRSADFLVAHNAKFELGWLRRCGLDLREVIVYDTQIGEYVLGGNRFKLQHLSLNATAKRYGLGQKEDVVGKMWDHGIDTEDVPESWLLEYCERDVDLTHQIFLKQREKLRERNLLAVQYSRCLLTPVLADIEAKGLQLDEEKIDDLTKDMEEEYARATSELQDFADGSNPGSIKQRREYIFDTLRFEPAKDYSGRPMLTDGGDPSVSEDAMAGLVPRTEKQREYLSKYAHWASMHSDVTKYLRKFGECCKQDGGTLHASFNQCNTATHRLSSNGLTYKIQFQNLNRRFKPLFRARHDGWLVGEMDGAQLEFRVAAHLGRDRLALKDIVDGHDVHAYTASIIGCSRQDAKRHTFKPLYGGTSGTPAERAYYEAFGAKYPSIADTQRGWTHTVLRTKRLETEWGLTYFFPQCKMTQSGYITFTNSIYNYPVQALATAEIIPLAIVAAWHRMKDMESFIVNTVHDSIIAEIHPDEVELFHEVAKECLIKDAYYLMEKLYGVRLTVPLGAGVMVGTHWGSKDETVYQAEEELWIDAAREEGMI